MAAKAYTLHSAAANLTMTANSNRLAHTRPRSSGDKFSNGTPNVRATASSNSTTSKANALRKGTKRRQGRPSQRAANTMPFWDTLWTNPTSSILFSSRLSEANKRAGLDSLFQLLKSDTTLSSDELMFIHLVMISGLEEAIARLTKPLLRCQRPLQALLSALSESDKSCSMQSVAQLLPSG